MKAEIKERIEMVSRGEVPEGYKKTKVGIVPEDWEMMRMGDIAEVVTGTTPSTKKKEYYEDGKYPWITPTDITENKYISRSERYLTEKGLKEGRFIPAGSLLVTCIASIGKNAILTVDGSCNQQINAILPNIDYSNEFLYYLICDKVDYIKSFAGKTATKIINKSTFESLKFLVPSLLEQKSIAKILSTWDKAIELKEQLIEKKKEQKKGLMQILLTGEVRLPGFNGEWEVKRLGEISSILRGASPRPISDSKWFDENSEVGWVRISDVTKANKVLTETEQYLSPEGIAKSRKAKKDNIIMSICATVGKPIYTGFDVCIHDGFVVFDKLSVDKEFFYYILLQKEKSWKKYGQTGSQMNLNTDIVGNEKVNIPPLFEEQKAIAQVLSTADKEIELLEEELEQLKLQKKGLMQLLLTGIIRVKS